MKALLVSGSARTGSNTRKLVTAVERELQKLDVATTLWDLAEQQVPAFEVPFHKDQSLVVDANARAFLDGLNDSDMVVIGTALYHGSYTGILKNALDYLLKDQLLEKPVGLLSNGGGNTKNAQALNHLVTITQTLYGVPMQTQIGTSGDDFDDEQLTNPDTIARCRRLAGELVRFHKALA